MKFYHKIAALALLSVTAFISCSDDKFAELNTDPNRPGNVPTPTLILSAEKQVMDNIRHLDFSLNGTMLFAQYYSQNIYTDVSRYDIPRNNSDRYWADAYKALNNLNDIINLNTNPATKAFAAAGAAGTNANQIAICRVYFTSIHGALRSSQDCIAQINEIRKKARDMQSASIPTDITAFCGG